MFQFLSIVSGIVCGVLGYSDLKGLGAFFAFNCVIGAAVCAKLKGDVKSHFASWDKIFVAGGFVEINPETCTVLAEEAVPVADIDKGAANDRLQEAQKALAEAGDDKAKADAENAVTIAEAMVAAAG